MICPNCGSVQAYDASSCTICGYEFGVSKTGAKSSKPSPESAQEIVIRNFSTLFDHKKFGINFSVGVGYFIASILAIFTWRIVNQIMWHDPQFNLTFKYYLIFISFNLLQALLFVILAHSLKKEWTFPLLFGLGMIVLGIFQRLVLGVIRIENMNFWSPFSLQGIIFNFVWGFLFMGGLVLLVKHWGLSLWNFVLVMMVVLSIPDILHQLYYFIQGSSFYFGYLITPAINGIFFGLFIYVALTIHLSQRGYRLANGNLCRK